MSLLLKLELFIALMIDLAILCGVGQNAISLLIDTVITSSCPEFLKPLQNIDIALITSSSEFKT